MTSNQIDAIITTPVLINDDVFHFWIEGMTVEEAADALSEQPNVNVFRLAPELIVTSVRDQYAQFAYLETALLRPDAFLSYSTLGCALDSKTRQTLIDQYYSLDDVLLRELIGSKLSARFRANECGDKCGVRPRSRRRQYENLRRVARLVEDSSGGRMTEIIRQFFCLSQPLTEVYTTMIFLSANRFETSKRCFSGATFADFAYCAEQLMTYWTSNNTDAKMDCPIDLELDFEFCGELKTLKILAENQTYLERHKCLVLRQLSASVSPNCLNGVEANFKVLSKVITTIATGLSHAREVRDLFLDIVEKLIEVVVASQWTYQEFSSFLASFDETLRVLPPARSSSFQRCWKRFFAPFKSIALRLYRLPNE